MAANGSSRAQAAAPQEHLNSVHLVGRLAAAAEDRLLPSGDALATFRMVVERPERDAWAAGRHPGLLVLAGGHPQSLGRLEAG